MKKIVLSIRQMKVVIEMPQDIYSYKAPGYAKCSGEILIDSVSFRLRSADASELALLTIDFLLSNLGNILMFPVYEYDFKLFPTPSVDLRSQLRFNQLLELRLQIFPK